jgi:opacity protein-like surface antigen
MMRRFLGTAAMAAAMLAAPAVALAQGNAQITGFGGLTARAISPATTFGGSLAVPLGDNVQIIAEGGRMSDVMSPTLSTLLDFTPIDVRLSAYYGAAGVRILGGSRSAVRPYAEATAGFARLHTSVRGIGEPDPYINAALQFFDSTRPMLGAGGGVVLQGGPMLLDLGYRYNRISSGNALQSALTFGNLGVHQFRAGVGVRF